MGNTKQGENWGRKNGMHQGMSPSMKALSGKVGLKNHLVLQQRKKGRGEQPKNW